MSRWGNLEAVVGVALLPIGAAVVYESHRVGYTLRGVPGPGFLSLWIGILLCLCAVMLLAESRSAVKLAAGDRRTFWLHVAAMGGLIVGIYYLGVLIAGCLYLLVSISLIGKHRFLTSVLAVVGVLVVVVAVMQMWLGISIPGGVLM